MDELAARLLKLRPNAARSLRLLSSPAVGDAEERRCGTCGAYTRYAAHPSLGVVGNCARGMRAYPVTESGVCSEWRGRGTAAERAPDPPKRARPVARPGSPPVAARTLPEEIDLDMDIETFRKVLSEVIREELGVSEVALGGRWLGGELILKPGKEGTAEKRVPIETFFHKIVMLRDRLRVLEQKVNTHPQLAAEDKVALQQYVTGCYGTLTTFNVLFADAKEDGFHGAGKDE